MSRTRESPANDIWRACDILRRDNNCGGVMQLRGVPVAHMVD